MKEGAFVGVLGTCGTHQPFGGSVSLVITYRLTDKRPLQRAHVTLGVPLVKSSRQGQMLPCQVFGESAL